jgi:hypothetical protein
VLSTWLGYRRLFLVFDVTVVAVVRLLLTSIVEGGLTTVLGGALAVMRDLFLSYIIVEDVLLLVYRLYVKRLY